MVSGLRFLRFIIIIIIIIILSFFHDSFFCLLSQD